MIRYAVISIYPNEVDRTTGYGPHIEVDHADIKNIKTAEKLRAELVADWPNSSQNIQVISYKVPE